MKLPDIGKAYVGGREVRAAYLGSTKVWPAVSANNYEVVSGTVQVHYSSGTMITAGGVGYAYLTGTVNVWDDNWETLIDTRYNQRLDPELAGGTGSFYIIGTEIHADNLLSTPSAMGTAYVLGSYGGSVAVEAEEPVYQQANEITSTSYGAWSYGEWEWLRDETVYRGHSVHISATAYTTLDSPAPGNGGIFLNLLNYGASHEEAVESFYEREKSRTVTYTWTSGVTSYGTDTDTDEKMEMTEWATVADTPILTKSAEWITINRRGVVFERNATNAPRSVTITAQHPLAPTTQTASVTLYQARVTVPRLIADLSGITMTSAYIDIPAAIEHDDYTGDIDWQSEITIDGGSHYIQSGTARQSESVSLGAIWQDMEILPVPGRQFTLHILTMTKYPNDSWEASSAWEDEITLTYP